MLSAALPRAWNLRALCANPLPPRLRVSARTLFFPSDPLRNGRDKLLELRVVAQVEIALREGNLDAVLLEQPPGPFQHPRPDGADAVFRIGDPEANLEVDRTAS